MSDPGERPTGSVSVPEQRFVRAAGDHESARQRELWSVQLRWALEWVGLVGGLLAIVALLASTMNYLRSSADRKKAKHYAAWQIVNAAAGQRAGGGRRLALRDLIADGVNLTGVNLSRAAMDGMDFRGAELTSADFRGATLNNADLSEANLSGALFSGSGGGDVVFSRVNAQLTDFVLANFLHTKFDGADLRGANFDFANLYGADLSSADLERAFLRAANFYKADLSGIRNWRSIESLEHANLRGALNMPTGFREWALEEMGAVEIEPAEWFERHHEARSNANEYLFDP